MLVYELVMISLHVFKICQSNIFNITFSLKPHYFIDPSRRLSILKSKETTMPTCCSQSII